MMDAGIVEGSMSSDMGIGEVISDPMYSEPMVDGVISAPPLVQGDMSVESWSDTGTVIGDGDAVVEQPFDQVPKEPMVDSGPAKEQVPPEPKPSAEKKSNAAVQSDKPKTDELFGGEAEKPEPKKPKAEQPKQDAPMTDDIFGSDTPAPADKPATPSTDNIFGSDTPAPADKPATPSTDDIFGSDTPAPADKPATPSTDDIFGSDTPAPADSPAPADASLDSLFDSAPADAAPADAPMPADQPGTSDPSIDSLFDDAPATEAPATEGPATGTPANDAPLDDLFGTPSTDEPTPGPKTESNESFDDLFGTPSGDDSAAPAATESLDDLFGMPRESSEPAERSKPTPSIDDLFGHSLAPPGEELVSELVESYEGDLPAPLVKAASKPTEPIASAEIKEVQVVSAKTKVTLDPLAETRDRVWIDNTGDFRTEGRLIEVGLDSVRLLKSNGKTCTVPRDRLSEADAAYVSGIQTKIEAMPLAMVTPR